MATKAGMRKVIEYMAHAGLSYAPTSPADILERGRVWLDALGDCEDADLDHAARAWVSGVDRHDPQGRRGRVFPAPAELIDLLPVRRQGIDQEQVRPEGCKACGGSGGRVLLWVVRLFGGRLAARRRAVLCDCAKGAWLADEHRRNPEGSRMKSARETAEDMHQQPRGRLDGSGPRNAVLWWTIPGAGDSMALPADLAQALADQDEQDRARDEEARRKARALSQPTGRRGAPAPRAAPERMGKVFDLPLRPDQGWEQGPEWLGGGA